MRQSPGTALSRARPPASARVYADRLALRGHDLLVVARDANRLAHLAARLERDFASVPKFCWGT
ncbi:hypothetical protein SAMN04488498_112141 [Mesorhizobium albiziae]|uniref:Uncharacterized protein n=1 Tax=Neomesorhizobium albiziae TaxID=335020 RepID=A0A1I4CE67_9HYPH|nr:hypothetical protein SAMN04488498_112141 [Mesorhizobium albiziae]